MYPLKRRGTLCSIYIPTLNFDINKFRQGEEVIYVTKGNKVKRGLVQHVSIDNETVLLLDLVTNKTKILIDDKDIKDAYSDLFSENKREFAGWWNKRITILNY